MVSYDDDKMLFVLGIIFFGIMVVLCFLIPWVLGAFMLFFMPAMLYRFSESKVVVGWTFLVFYAIMFIGIAISDVTWEMLAAFDDRSMLIVLPLLGLIKLLMEE